MSIIDITELEEERSFRDELASITSDGRRKWIYARQPKGKFYTARSIVAVFLLAFLFLSPHIRLNGHQFMLLNILERKFIILGVPFMPQDFHLVVLLALTTIVSIALFTAVLGRIWCGWLCPQTIFLEMLFRRIEWLIEGSPKEQVLLDKGAWNGKKTGKKVLKHSIFYALSFLIANTFLAYIIGSDQLWHIITDDPRRHLAGLGIITAFSAVFYAVFARFREQACLIACPYGRYMSALVDTNTIAVTYDFKRGEPRGKFTRADRAAAPEEHIAKGDCIDCHQCVVVCPTGIDIRNGIQLECVNCTACIDACDMVMEKVGKPKGLIRYTSWNAVKTSIQQVFTARIKGYLAVWLILLTLVTVLFMRRGDSETLIMRQPGTTFVREANGALANFFNVAITNKTFNPLNTQLVLLQPKGIQMKALGSLSPVAPLSTLDSRILLSFPPGTYKSGKNPVRFAIVSDGKVLEEVETVFIAP
jgi:cytochrome c oxidase accessory protein FixG